MKTIKTINACFQGAYNLLWMTGTLISYDDMNYRKIYTKQSDKQ